MNEDKQLPSNRNAAERRLLTTTNKLKGLNLLGQYSTIFLDWLKEGIIEEIGEDDKPNCFYLPHRAVIKPESLTTPVRPVFDASAKVNRNPSLNESLYKGPNLLELIFNVLLKFREKRIGVISDIRKAFQMIEVHEDDRDYLRFLWWDDSYKKYRIFRHRRVVFGVNCSPFLLAAVLEHHLDNVEPKDME